MSQRFPKKKKGTTITHRWRWHFGAHLNVFAPWILWPLGRRFADADRVAYRVTVLMLVAELARVRETIEQTPVKTEDAVA